MGKHSNRITLGALALVGLMAGGAARADVMQIGASGAEWVTGGPAGFVAESGVAGDVSADTQSGVGFVGAAAPPVADPVAADLAEAPVALQSITQVLGAAGPARWRERVAALAAKYDISPALLEAVVWQESRWNELAMSRVGARGLAQLMPGTAAQMGVNAADPLANLEGGARYLRLQLDAFHGDVEKALAAYNAGPARVAAAGGIPNIRETRAYVASIMARLTNQVRQ